jgi:hypothetical protein
MLFAIIAGVTIFAVSIIVGYLFFSVMESSAEATLQNFKLGGAIAGFAFSAILLTSITFQFYKQVSQDEVADLRNQVLELQSKLLRGVNPPEGYSVEIDERHKLVFSRPQGWLPKEGVLFNYEDGSGSNFNVTYQSADNIVEFYQKAGLLGINVSGGFDFKNPDTEKLYEDYLSLLTQVALQVAASMGEVSSENCTKEYVVVDDIRSMKAILTYTLRNREDEKKVICGCQCFVLTYVPALGALFYFIFSDRAERYLRTSEAFNNVLLSVRFLSMAK